MVIYEFVRGLFAWSVLVAILCPLTIPWLMLSYKIWHGNKEIDEEMSDELLPRSWRLSFLYLIVSPVFVFVDYLIVDQLGMPAGPTHIVFYIGFMSFVAGVMMLFYALEDFFQGLMMAVIFLYLPATVFYLLWWLIGWNPLFEFILGWLAEPAAY